MRIIDWQIFAMLQLLPLIFVTVIIVLCKHRMRTVVINAFGKKGWIMSLIFCAFSAVCVQISIVDIFVLWSGVIAVAVMIVYSAVVGSLLVLHIIFSITKLRTVMIDTLKAVVAAFARIFARCCMIAGKVKYRLKQGRGGIDSE